ncbi:MAG: hypothetical protein ACHQ02_04530 [Candidatus Limnocylindrales bacterium]
MRASRALLPAVVVAALALAPMPVLAHQIGDSFRSPLPLSVYLLGAAIAVGVSFALVFRSDAAVGRPPPGRVRRLPAWARWLLRVVGVLAWLWIVVQVLVVGGSSDADVSSLFLWVYGWVGLALVSGLIGPVWSWLDPFLSGFDLLAAGARRLTSTRTPARWPRRLGRWPAVAGFAFFVWLELVVTGGAGGRNLVLTLLAYTILTWIGMAWFGRTRWRRQAEVFSVWFGLLGRLAPWRTSDDLVAGREPGSRRVVRQAFGDGLIHARWAVDEVVLVALATGAVMFDGLSQTLPWFELFGLPGFGGSTVLLFGFLGLVVLAVLAVGRWSGLAAVGAGLVPIAIGYITAHYLTFLIADGQRILIAVSDPFQQGWDLFGTAFWQVSITFLPGVVVWIIQLLAVVSGHAVGAWAGHAASTSQAPSGTDRRTLVRRQLPLAVLMIALTVITLWSLGQLVVEPPSP